MIHFLVCALNFAFAAPIECHETLLRRVGLTEWTRHDDPAHVADELRGIFKTLVNPDAPSRQWHFDLSPGRKAMVVLSRRGEVFELTLVKDSNRQYGTDWPLLRIGDDGRIVGGLWIGRSDAPPLRSTGLYVDRPNLSFVVKLEYERQRMSLALRFERGGRTLAWLDSKVELQRRDDSFTEVEITGTLSRDGASTSL